MNFEVDHHSETKLKMDIPKQPVKSVLSQSATNDSTASDTARLSSVQDLKLQPGKAYPARVIRGPESLPDETLKPSSAGRPSNAPPSPGSVSVTSDAQTMTLKNDQYLVRINGKTVLVSSEKALEAGMKIILSTDPKSTIQRPSLIVQLAPESSAKQANPLFQKLSESLKTLAGQTLPTSTSSAQPNLSTQQIPQLLQALNVLLDKQVTLQTGLQQLSTYLASTPADEQALAPERNQATGATTSRTPTSDSQLSPVLKATLQHLLHKTILKVEHLQALASHQPAFSSAQSAQSIQHSIRNSGLFLENSLSQQPANLTAFKAQLATLQHSLGLVSTANPDTKNMANMANSTAVQSLQKIQQTIDFLLSGTKSGSASSTLNQTQSDAIMQDLKASLLTASSLLARQLSKELSADALKNLFLLPQADTYALSPFAFPLLPSQQSGSAKPLFDKQNFTTGQLLKLLAGMIHRMQFNQLNSLMQSSHSSADTNLQQSWFIELPVMSPHQQVNTFNLRVDKEKHSQHHDPSDEEKVFSWKLLLSFDLDELGPIYVQVKLQDKTINSVLWADRSDTLSLLKKETPRFKSSLESIGLQVNELHCMQGQPPNTATKLDRHLVDTKA